MVLVVVDLVELVDLVAKLHWVVQDAFARIININIHKNKWEQDISLDTRSSRRKRGMASNSLFVIPDFFFAFSHFL